MRTLIKVSLLFQLSFILVSCSLFSSTDRTSKSPPIRNVPYQARSGIDTGLRKRIMILPFVDEKVDRSLKVISVARSTVVKQLGRTGRFVIVKNSDFPQDPGKFLTESREYDLEKIAPMALSMGISAVIEGKILEVKAKRIGDQVGVFRKIKARIETTVRIRVVSTKNSRIILEEVRTGAVEATTTRVAEYSYSDKFLSEDPNLVRKAVNRAFNGSIGKIAQAIEKISWEGRVALISGERVFINAGRLSGIQVGDILKVTEEGEEVYDPEDGAFIGHAPGRMKGTIEVVSYFGGDGAIAIVHSGSGFRENDRVEIY